jgi:hypothetical protein
MAATQTKTGKAGNITIGGNVVPITKWSGKLNVSFADSTDSGNYNAGSGNLYKSQLPGDQHVEGSIEGFYDTATTSTNITSNIKNPTSGPYALVLKFDGSTTWFNGNVDFENVDFTVQVPGATIINFTASFKSNGSYTLT